MLPEAGGGGEGIEYGTITLQQPGAEDVRGAAIDEVPVVDPFRVREVEADDALLGGGVPFGPAETAHEHQQGEEPLFMPFGVQQVQDVRLAEGIGVGQLRTDLGHLEPEKVIALTILTGPRFEKTPGDGYLGGMRGFAELLT